MGLLRIMIRKKRRDKNEREIISALRAAGYSVAQLHGDGIPDLLVGKDDKNWLFEVKSESGKLTDSQILWHNQWLGQVDVICNVAQMWPKLKYR